MLAHLKSYWPRCVGTPTKGGAVLMEAIGVIAYHRDKMPTKVILDMNTGRRVDSNIWHLPRKWGCTWTSTKFQPLWCSVKEPLSLTMLKKQEKNDVGDDDMDLYRLNWSTSALAVIGVHCNPASRRPPMHFLLHKALESSAILCTVPQIHLYFPMHSEGFPPYLGPGLGSEL